MQRKNVAYTVERDGKDYEVIFRWQPETYTWKVKIYCHHRFTCVPIADAYVGDPSFDQAFELLEKYYPILNKKH